MNHEYNLHNPNNIHCPSCGSVAMEGIKSRDGGGMCTDCGAIYKIHRGEMRACIMCSKDYITFTGIKRCPVCAESYIIKQEAQGCTRESGRCMCPSCTD